jgi:hypothetical protein
MKRLKEKSNRRNTSKYNPMQCEDPATAAAMMEHLIVLTGPLAIDAAWRSAVSANLVDPWPRSFDELSTSDKMNVLAHCVCLAYGRKSKHVQSIEHFDPVG